MTAIFAYPLSVAMLASVLRPLVRLCAGTPQVRIRTVTAVAQSDGSGRPYPLYHTWSEPAVRALVLKRLLEREGWDVSFVSEDRNTLPHARTFQLVAPEGESLKVLLDQGLGYWRTQRAPPFAFTGSLDFQVKTFALRVVAYSTASACAWS